MEREQYPSHVGVTIQGINEFTSEKCLELGLTRSGSSYHHSFSPCHQQPRHRILLVSVNPFFFLLSAAILSVCVFGHCLLLALNLNSSAIMLRGVAYY